VTYGGISSGIALHEAGQLLKKSGRTVIAGMKVASSHRMTRAFLPEEYNRDKPGEKLGSVIQSLVNHIKNADIVHPVDNAKSLRYQSIETHLKANLIFKEKVWHEKRYPKVIIDKDECRKCGKCAKMCPVNHLIHGLDAGISFNNASACIHCFNCIVACSHNAISLQGDLERAKHFMAKMIGQAKEFPETCLYPE